MSCLSKTKQNLYLMFSQEKNKTEKCWKKLFNSHKILLKENLTCFVFFKLSLTSEWIQLCAKGGKPKGSGKFIMQKISSGSTVHGTDMQKESAGLLCAPGWSHCNSSQMQLWPGWEWERLRECHSTSNSRGPAWKHITLSGGNAGLSSPPLLLANLYLADT